MSNHLVVAADGTSDVHGDRTAIARITDALRQAGINTIYEQGLGTRRFEKISGTLWAAGFNEKVRRLTLAVLNERFDHLTILGFSRGGAEALAIANNLATHGVLCNFVGLFDPVATTLPRIPLRWLRQPPGVTYSALAMFESRREYWPIVWRTGLADSRLTQRWAKGWHGDIGGRYAGEALDWMISRPDFPVPELEVEPPQTRRHLPRSRFLLPRKRRYSLFHTLAFEEGLD